MDIAFMITIFMIGFIGAFISGMIGIGGSVINYPMLLYIPSLAGVMSLTAHEVSGIGAIQVFFATLGGVWAYRKSGFLNKPLITYMGSSILIGSVLGSYFSHRLSEQGMNFIYGILAIIAVILMFTPKKGQEHREGEEITFQKWLASSLAFIIGGVSGVLGAGGAFILVPIMLSILNIPVRITVASSLAITFISSIGATIGKVMTGQVLFGPALVLMIASLIASPLGAKVGQKVNTQFLQWVLALLIAATAIKIWLGYL
ncbi:MULTISPECIES: sulfite exporter TauE/SafE family protein [Bacillus]|uniref:sulfite exporter TauE/SafE family protein n=1 Tax=Bacillus TaxID=1386 RepID=UPI0013EF1DB3|nr:MULTISPECIES: sulfite exporter TauE/SafE family protein [Bacillus]MDN5386638.1 sulfite exporter TauE/SafE family protein [Bacillus sp. LB7]MEC1024079.1 sulfite exporter TauE/SafE family protein [Bacillus paralicheniformis]MEC1024936.1 sulfite exporter TauE/SafE family protein [Bacillus paralicheniformis]MEC1033655.1 sulfite exporter TauE/SafE family protein [Bacillus paralicheniformis]MEC1051751.1 sulfite exporter TauE/SafE family protein [Bacillus paralicheniformis]